MSLVAGDILGTLFTYEVMTAFVEAGFLGVLLFGWNRVSPKLHFTATCLLPWCYFICIMDSNSKYLDATSNWVSYV